ncbi:hypothetical protein BDN72DRAFT_865269 [Pluteus cervinus]|uniref:Uncharacterized protein n=1 Tax=Pluteus cervinus TaxID=181527 RepID=A0ACD3A0U9_9AGAR|nr:hypothetical protein BDN72DRAFT_865269 [Pluteus cervinus]
MSSNRKARFSTARFAIEPETLSDVTHVSPDSFALVSSKSTYIFSLVSFILGITFMIHFSAPTALVISDPSVPMTNFAYPDGVLLPKFTTVPAYRTAFEAFIAYHVPYNFRRTNPARFLAGDDPSWCFHGTNGTIAIALSQPVLPSHVVIRRDRFGFFGSLPRTITVWGLVAETNYYRLSQVSPRPLMLEKNGHVFARIATADYQVHSPQAFRMDEHIIAADVEFPLMEYQLCPVQKSDLEHIQVEFRGIILYSSVAAIASKVADCGKLPLDLAIQMCMTVDSTLDNKNPTVPVHKGPKRVNYARIGWKSGVILKENGIDSYRLNDRPGILDREVECADFGGLDESNDNVRREREVRRGTDGHVRTVEYEGFERKKVLNSGV